MSILSRKRATLALLSGAFSILLSSCSMPSVASLWESPSPPPPALSRLDLAEGKAASSESRAKSPLDEVADEGPLVTGIREAGLQALQYNASFRIERLVPAIRNAAEEAERAAFDPVLSADVSIARAQDDKDTETAGVTTNLDTWGMTRTGKIGLTQTLPTGTTIGISGQRTLGDTDGKPSNAANYSNLSATDTYDLTVTQSLLRGFGPKVNLARLRQAKLDTRISRYVLKAAAEELLYQTEATGWDYLLSQRQIAIYEDSLQIAEEQLTEVRERIKVGALADIELAAVQAEVAQRKEDLINARSALAKTRLEFFHLVGKGGTDRWQRELTLTDEPTVPEDMLAPMEQHVDVALKQRPDLSESRLRIERGELDVVRTKNGLLPRLDFFITLGGSRYAKSFGSTNKDEDGHSRDLEAGLQLEYALGNRAERATYEQSLLSLTQLNEALRNQEDLAQVDVRTAYLEVERTAEQIQATAATHKHQEAALRSETEKFRVGKSTSLLVAQAQRDLVASRIAEIESVVQHLKARLNLYRQEGSLLERRGISLDTP